MNKREIATQIFLAGVERVKPQQVIHQLVELTGEQLKVDKITFNMRDYQSIYVVGAGKASAMMAQALEYILGDRIKEGHIITKYGHSVSLSYIQQTEAGHPVPDEAGVRGTSKLLEIAKKAGHNDLVFCLLSGGGSALLADVPENGTLSDLKILNEVLLKSGATIQEMNCIRKHLSKVKGGQLAKEIYPASIVNLILSDVVGDPLDVIASGPTIADSSTFSDAITILKQYSIEDEIPTSIRTHLTQGNEGKKPETPKENDRELEKSFHLIVGNNLLALEAAAIKAEELGYCPQIITHTLEGDLITIGNQIFQESLEKLEQSGDTKVCLLYGGEPTVKVKGEGKGGRNQHLALYVARLIKDQKKLTFLSAGTDGSDGPTDAAGAVCDSSTVEHAKELGLNYTKHLGEFNAYPFFEREGGLIVTGPTQTNVMDLITVLIN